MFHKKIKIHRKLLITISATIVIISAMSILISFTQNTPAVLLNINNTFTVKIPENINYKKEYYVTGNEITQHYTLFGVKDYKNTGGYIQVRQLTSPIENYVRQSEQNFSASVYDYSRKPVLINGSTGFELNFKIKGDRFDTQVMQTLWQRGTSIYVLSLSSPVSNTKTTEKAFDEIRNSVTFSGYSSPSGKLTEYCIRYN